MKHQRTVKNDNMMREGLRKPQDERQGQGQPSQQVLLSWAVREPRRSRRTRRELNYAPVFASHRSEICAMASASNQSILRSKNLGKSKVQEEEVLKAVKQRKRVLERQITKGLSKRTKNLGKTKVQEEEVLKALKHRKRVPEQITEGLSKKTKEPAENMKAHVQRVKVESLHNQELQNLGKSKVQEEEVLKAVKQRKRVPERQITKGLSKRTKNLGKSKVQEEEVLKALKHRKRVPERQITEGLSKKTKEPAENIKAHVQLVNVESLHNEELQNLGKSKVQEEEVLKAVKQSKRVPERLITKGLSKRTKEPVENIKAHVQRVNVESLHNQELQELANMKAEIKLIKEEQERINLKLSTRREEELKEIAKRKSEFHILQNNIRILKKEQDKLMLMTVTHIQGKGLRQEVVSMSADTKVLKVSAAGKEAVTSGETHVPDVSSCEHQVLKVVSSGENHLLEVAGTSLPAALEENRVVLPDLNDPVL